MEVEVKLRLPDAISHQRLSNILSPFRSKVLLQENVFFDGTAAELSSNLAVLRLRFYGGTVDSSCIVSLKSKPVISAGISRVEEDEEPIDATIARASISEPWRLLSVDSSRVLRRVKDEFGIGEKFGLVCLGGFKNVRQVFIWNGLTLELDETHYDFGTSYEIECESSDPENAKCLIEEMLKINGIPYSFSQFSKFAIFRSAMGMNWWSWLSKSRLEPALVHKRNRNCLAKYISIRAADHSINTPNPMMMMSNNVGDYDEEVDSYMSNSIEQIKWDAMFQNLKPT